MEDEDPNVAITVESDVTLDAEDLSEAIGDQLIIGGRGEPFSYLAGLAFDGMTSDFDIVEILVEYLHNESAFDLSEEQINDIESALRDSYTG